jgi:hypothetical protein
MNLKWRTRELMWRIRSWWRNRWFNRNRKKLRNVAAWAVHHHSGGGIHDATSILKGQADKRISEAAEGRI